LTCAPDGLLNNVLVESYAIHLRTLIDFLYANPKQPDDLSAIDYGSGREPWLDARGTTPGPVKVARERAHSRSLISRRSGLRTACRRNCAFGGALSFEFDLWGKIRRANESSRAQLLASEEARATVLSSLVAEVATDYLQLRELDLELELQP
jgi:hypothetical protein